MTISKTTLLGLTLHLDPLTLDHPTRRYVWKSENGDEVHLWHNPDAADARVKWGAHVYLYNANHRVSAEDGASWMEVLRSQLSGNGTYTVCFAGTGRTRKEAVAALMRALHSVRLRLSTVHATGGVVPRSPGR
jgi:hypothetical protein